MYLCLKLYLQVDATLEKYLLTYEQGFKKEVVRICDLFKQRGKVFEYPYRYFNKSISYNSKHLVLATAKEMYLADIQKKRFTYGFSSYWSNSSYTIDDDLKLELGLDFHRDKLLVPYYLNAHTLKRIKEGKLMNMKLIKRKSGWHALIYVCYEPEPTKSERCMGVDIGIKVPAVCAISQTQYRFFGNGRQIRFEQRRYCAHIKAMQRGKQFGKLKRYEHKLSHILNNFDHHISSEIIAYAIENDIGVIKLENLTAINQKFKVSGTPNIYLWSYRRLQEYIAYKASLNGIKVKYINPYHTSQICPSCGQLNHAKDRKYICSCGYHNHRDIVAAINILNAL
ncbi:RNA-guided endonuclease TnpB family protein [Amedibacillus sp. YH-ame10]